jgi:glycosyltransferase involved in cell wall biosynthesis
MIDLANAFAATGCEVAIIAGRLAKRSIPLNQEVGFKKIIQYNRKNFFNRVATWLIASIQIIFLLITKYRKHHLFVVSNPPFAPLIPLLFQNSFSLLIYDVYPDALTEAGILSKNNYFIKLWQKANIKSFCKAEHIYTITEGMKKILNQYAENKNIEVIPIWSDTHLKPIPRHENEFIRRHKLEGQFIIMYSGNLGSLNSVDVLIDIIAKIKNKKISLIIIGKGARLTDFEKKAKAYNLNNFLLLPWQDASDLLHTFAAANLAVISLGKSASKLGIPSKIYNFMSVGSPMLGLASSGSDLDILIDHYQIGKCFTPENQDGIKQYIEYLFENDSVCAEFSKNALDASLNFTSENVYKFLKT